MEGEASRYPSRKQEGLGMSPFLRGSGSPPPGRSDCLFLCVSMPGSLRGTAGAP